ncbi:sulfite exporter TauE/SafE family protein [Actinomadura rugatobispora]|uniref:Sulfite exporter TauE/SafE family protein n=1 Tax=Actinomadura rugatobispora TaxID=1994 RepID=A0ABW0ZT04_9ACTN|nr:hypothetical protein GCM10010200_102280 [Actinomadura rugatobispora]
MIGATAMAAAGAAGALALGPPLGQPVAHPLGTFTVSRYDGLVAAPHELRIDHVQDHAEIPAAQVLRSTSDLPRWAARECAGAVASFRVTVDGRPVAATVRTASARRQAGQAGLPTLRLECGMAVPYGDGSHRLTFQDTGAAGRIGWHEVTAAGDRMTLVSSDVPRASRSARLTTYPEDLLDSPPDQRGAVLAVREGGPPLAASGGGREDRILPRDAYFTDLVSRHALTPGFAVLALLVALGLGALHALAPGHGKTIMAAQAAGQARRSRREALALGVTVTATHTAGVLALGLLVASGSAVASPALFPWLGAACGAIVAVAGLTLLRRALRNRRDHPPHHHHGHGHGHHHHHASKERRRRNVLLMGFAGGLMPSPSAVVVLLGASALGHAWFGVLLVLAYGAGLALTLVTIGMLVTGTGRLLARRLPALGDRIRAAPALLPTGTAAMVILLGVGLTARSLASLTA